MLKEMPKEPSFFLTHSTKKVITKWNNS